jgi:hypothetical protein
MHKHTTPIPRFLAGAADERDRAYVNGAVVVRNYDTLFALLRADKRKASAREVFDAAYAAAVRDWTVEQAYELLMDTRERV